MNFEVKVIGGRVPADGSRIGSPATRRRRTRGLAGLRVGDAWRAPKSSLRRVFSTRSPYRPNPIGQHQLEITAIEDGRVRVRNLEALHGTPIIDVKPMVGCGYTSYLT